jgi:hypothetical protein
MIFSDVREWPRFQIDRRLVCPDRGAVGPDKAARRLGMFRDMLVHVDGKPAGRLRIQFAVDLAARTGTRITGLHVTPPIDVPPWY